MDCEITLNMGRKPTQNKKTYTCERCGCTFTSDIDEKIRLCYSCTADFVEWLDNHVKVTGFFEERD